MSMPLDRTKPLWHLDLVDGYGSGCATVFRIHHSTGDGVALGQAPLSLTDPADGAGVDTHAGPDAHAGGHHHGLTGMLTRCAYKGRRCTGRRRWPEP